LASSLNHPHVLTVHDAGGFEGREYLVTEFVDGGTLKNWTKGERTWSEIVELLTTIAGGLAAAHAAGITHRDIKAANILVFRNGYAKLADFGLAKLTEPVRSGDYTSTLTETTRPGVIVGTVAYMSPEQASGKPVDGRSDIFSFGVVLYEALSGRRPFDGSSELEVLKSIIHGAPDPLGKGIPPRLRAVVEKALEKTPEERYQSMRELVVDLRRLLRQSGESSGAALREPPSSRQPARAVLVSTLVAVLALASTGIWWSASHRPVPDKGFSPVRLTKLTNFPGEETDPAFSPDGRSVAFSWDGETGNNRDIYVIAVGAQTPVRLTQNPASDVSPARSPDGKQAEYIVMNAVGSHSFD
jgi:serine/threonine protein kinase